MKIGIIAKKIFACFCFTACVANAANLEYRHFENYTTADGLSSDEILSLEQDSYGHIWVGTDLGLNRFDGSTFVVYSKEYNPALYRDDILQLKQTANGDVVAGGYCGMLVRYDHDSDLFFDVSPDDYATTYAKGCNGFGNTYDKLTALTTNGFYIYDSKLGKFSNDFALYKESSKRSINAVLTDKMNRYWIAANDGLKVMDMNGKIIFSDSPERDASPAYAPQLISVDNNKIMYSGQNGRLAYYVIGEAGKIEKQCTVTTPFGNIRKIVKLRKNGYWFATDGEGLWFCSHEPEDLNDFVKISPFETKEEQFSKLYCMIADRDGNLWIGSQNSGLWKYRTDNTGSLYTSSQIGVSGKLVNSFAIDADQNLVVASDGTGIYECSRIENKARLLGSQNGLTCKNVTSVDVDKDGNIWASTWGGGLYVKACGTDNFRQVKIDGVNSPQSNMMQVMHLKNGELWVCSGGDGIYVKRNNLWHHKILKHPAYGPDPDNWPQRMVEVDEHTRWIFTSSTIWIDKDEISVPIEVHYQGESKEEERSVNDAEPVDKYGMVLATTRGLLLMQMDGKSYEKIEFTPDGNYSSLAKDKNGKIWAAGTNGIVCVDLDKKLCTELPIDFGNKGSNFFVKNSSYVDVNGRVYFGSKNGFLSFDPANLPTSTTEKFVDFGRLKVKGEWIAPQTFELENGRLKNNGNLTLTYDRTDIEIEIDAVDFGDYKNHCRYKLDGLDNDWTDIGLKRVIKFSYIPAGDYTLRIQHHLNGNVGQEQALHITVTPPWWQSTWLKVLAAFLLVGYILYKWNSLRNKQDELQRMVDERTQDLRDKNAVIEKRNSELNQALGYKDKLIAVVAHDLKNPMFAIVGALDGLSKGESDVTESKETINNVLSSARKLQNELVKLLAWATSNHDDMEYRPANTHLQKTIEDDIALLQIQIENKGLTIDTKFDIDNYAYIDGRMISTAIRNLINNAIKFTPAGKGIHVRGWQDGDKIKVEVRDEGTGMSAEKIAEIQTAGKHSSTDGTSGEKGTGLGTGIAREYILQNQGTMQVESTLGEGTSFIITLPSSSNKLPDDETMQAEEKAREQLTRDVEVNRELVEGNTMLVVDDDPLIRQNIKNILQQYVNVLTASNGLEALELAKSNTVDIILSDVEMPVMNGIEMSRALAKIPDMTHVPILFLSAKSTESDRLLGLLTGAIDYIPKPFSRNELLIKLTNILSLRRKTQIKLLEEQMKRNAGIDIAENADAAENTQTETEPAEATGPVNESAESQTKPEVMNPQLQQILDLVAKNYANSEYTVEKLADDMCMTKITLYRRVKTLAGKSPIDILSDYRLSKALQMLKETEIPIGDVAYQVGFSDPAYFTRRFKAYFGYPPSAVREN